jgi:hypothetical protein
MHRDLPLPDYDQMPEGSIEHRIRSLDVDGVQLLLDHERAHANRPSVVMTLDRRLEELRAGAEPSGGSPQAEQPERAGRPRPDSAASPATEGPPINPPPHGDPTNPTPQPRR